MLDANFDESGKGNLLVMSCYVGQSGHWRKLETKWRDDLKKAGVACWHTSDFRSRKSRLFRHLGNQSRKELLNVLVSRINRYVDFGLTVTLDIAEYKSQTTPRFRSDWGSPYAFCFQACMLAIRLVLGKKRAGETVNVLLEEGHANAGQVINQLRQAKVNKNALLRIGAYGLGSKIDNPMLQTADMLAYASYERQVGKTVKPNIFVRLAETSESRPHWWLPCDAHVIRIANRAAADWLDKVKKLQAEGHTLWKQIHRPEAHPDQARY